MGSAPVVRETSSSRLSDIVFFLLFCYSSTPNCDFRSGRLCDRPELTVFSTNTDPIYMKGILDTTRQANGVKSIGLQIEKGARGWARNLTKRD
ncbi:hypothetical protein PAXRUDRAFT_757964 [Paxillus rubicundulus Ve08.2h10]|uniref:Uncharacterized protein n=1 Tax=Paxillus rubicundulus Ve08.2h10 TaxID=930991 RepID=A0A0D0E7M3_9AGAM|nr:hypothetical protein PAXRUDRAFT_757964 [Paxillus rubicundulus Ve08.2h10]